MISLQWGPWEADDIPVVHTEAFWGHSRGSVCVCGQEWFWNYQLLVRGLTLSTVVKNIAMTLYDKQLKQIGTTTT